MFMERDQRVWTSVFCDSLYECECIRGYSIRLFYLTGPPALPGETFSSYISINHGLKLLRVRRERRDRDLRCVFVCLFHTYIRYMDLFLPVYSTVHLSIWQLKYLAIGVWSWIMSHVRVGDCLYSLNEQEPQAMESRGCRSCFIFCYHIFSE